MLLLAAADLRGVRAGPADRGRRVVAAQLADLAAAALEAALAVARAEVGPGDAGDYRLAVIGMGKAAAAS